MRSWLLLLKVEEKYKKIIRKKCNFSFGIKKKFFHAVFAIIHILLLLLLLFY